MTVRRNVCYFMVAHLYTFRLKHYPRFHDTGAEATMKQMKTTLSSVLIGGALLLAVAGAQAAEAGQKTDPLTTGTISSVEQRAGNAGQGNVVNLFFSREKNPMVQFVVTMSENCPLDFVGLGRDLGEVAGLIDPPKLDIPEGGSFAERMQALQAHKDATKSVWKRMISRSCLLNKLFGDGTCNQ